MSYSGVRLTAQGGGFELWTVETAKARHYPKTWFHAQFNFPDLAKLNSSKLLGGLLT
jgi:hypothetical protein